MNQILIIRYFPVEVFFFSRQKKSFRHFSFTGKKLRKTRTSHGQVQRNFFCHALHSDRFRWEKNIYQNCTIWPQLYSYAKMKVYAAFFFFVIFYIPVRYLTWGFRNTQVNFSTWVWEFFVKLIYDSIWQKLREISRNFCEIHIQE